jgi:hypothetical protein
MRRNHSHTRSSSQFERTARPSTQPGSLSRIPDHAAKAGFGSPAASPEAADQAATVSIPQNQ